MADLGSFSPNAEKEIARKRRMAELLLQQSQAQGTQMAGNIAIPQSPIEHLMRGLQTGIGYYQSGKADEAEQDLEAKRQALMADALAKMSSGDTRMAAMTLAQDPKNQAMAMQLMGNANNAELAAGKEDRAFQRQIQLMGIRENMKRPDVSVGGVPLPQLSPNQLVSDPQQIAAAMGETNAGSAPNMPPPLPIQGMATQAPQQDVLQPVLKNGLPITQGMPTGYQLAMDANGQFTKMPIPEPQIDRTPIAQQYGVPYQPLDTGNMSGTIAQQYAKETRRGAEKLLNSDDRKAARDAAMNKMQSVNRFNELMQGQDTGGLLVNTPLVGAAMQKFDPQLSEMASIRDRLAPQQRVAGSGSSSDIDVAMFKSAIIDPTKPAEANTNIGQAMKADAQRELDYQQFMSDYLSANGHINGADAAWKMYVDNNPIFDPTSTAQNLKLNKNRKSYKEFYKEGKMPPNDGVVDYKDFF